MYKIFIKYNYIIMYENNLQYHNIENFKGFKKIFKKKKFKKISIKPITNPINKTIIKPVGSELLI